MERLEIIGCYAQTELGHGSNVRGLETEAIYDHSTQEFIINTPSTSAYKWWIGTLGVSANYAIVIAQLKLNGEGYGPHPFLVPIRDMITHEPLPGADIGDIGPKMGCNGTDNGFIGFKNFRIPRKNMLARYSQVNSEGKYELLNQNSIKILYLSLVKSRAGIAASAWFPLSIATTIAIRYSLYRRQFPNLDKPNEETKILDYQIQQSKLFKPLSFLYGILFCKDLINQTYLNAERGANQEKSDSLQFAHGVLSLFKAFVTQNTSDGIELCRKSCGGHGYLMASGLPSLYTAYLPNLTFEGDNSILTLQAIKYIASLRSKNLDNAFSFLFRDKIIPQGNPLSSQFQQQCFQTVAQYKIQLLLTKYSILLKKGYKKDKIWNDYLQVEGIETAQSIFHSIFHNCYIGGIEKCMNNKNKEILENLRLIYAANELEQYKGEIINSGVTMDSLISIKQQALHALEVVRCNALQLIEAFELKDESLNSVLGNKNKDVYESLLESSKNLNKINKRKVFPNIKEILKPKI